MNACIVSKFFLFKRVAQSRRATDSHKARGGAHSAPESRANSRNGAASAPGSRAKGSHGLNEKGLCQSRLRNSTSPASRPFPSSDFFWTSSSVMCLIMVSQFRQDPVVIESIRVEIESITVCGSRIRVDLESS